MAYIFGIERSVPELWNRELQEDLSSLSPYADRYAVARDSNGKVFAFSILWECNNGIGYTDVIADFANIDKKSKEYSLTFVKAFSKFLKSISMFTCEYVYRMGYDKSFFLYRTNSVHSIAPNINKLNTFFMYYDVENGYLSNHPYLYPEEVTEECDEYTVAHRVKIRA